MHSNDLGSIVSHIITPSHEPRPAINLEPPDHAKSADPTAWPGNGRYVMDIPVFSAKSSAVAIIAGVPSRISQALGLVVVGVQGAGPACAARMGLVCIAPIWAP